MYKHTVKGKGSLQRAIQWARYLKSLGYMHKVDWDWVYHPSQQDEYREIEFWVKDESLLTILLLRDPSNTV